MGGRTMTPDQLSLFYRQIAVLLDTGMPLSEAFQEFETAHEIRGTERVVRDVLTDLREGLPLSDCLARHPKYFDPLVADMVGREESGERLARFFHDMADILAQAGRYRARGLQALTYPASLLGIALLVAAVATTYVVPVFEDIYSGFGLTLPAATQALLILSHWTREYLLLILLGLAVVALAALTMRGGLLALVSRAPFFGGVLNTVFVTEYARHLSILISFGIPGREAVDLPVTTVAHPARLRKVRKTVEQMDGAGSLREVLGASGVFPPLALQMVAIGEKSDSVAFMLSQVSRYYGEKADARFSTLMKGFDQLLIVLIAILVGFLVIALYLPVFKMSSLVV